MTQVDNKHSISGSFVSQISPITGLMQWKLVDSDYDFEQEIARSAYADMLHDYDRNRKYHEAICHVIRHMRATCPSRPIHVLDIGTGTGILSMMAARAGADTVTACEAFLPVAKCAKRILQDNNLADRVHVISKRSNEIKIGRDMPQRANVLVAELFDTELIGEGALETYRHAADHLLTTDALLIPCKSNLYMQVVESPFLWSHHKLQTFPSSDDDTVSEFLPSSIFPTKAMQDCHGCPSVFDLQASQFRLLDEKTGVKEHQGRAYIKCLLDKPVRFHQFDFSPPSTKLKLKDHKRITDVNGRSLRACVEGTAHALIVWWDLQMEPTGTIPPITISPTWAQNDSNSVWREHWMQAVYFPRNALNVLADQLFAVDFAHDAVSMWFDIVSPESNESMSIERPICTCAAHIAWPRPRLAQLNSDIFQQFVSKMSKKVSQSIQNCTADAIAVVVLSDASVLPLVLMDMLTKSDILHQKPTHIFHLECSPLSARVFNKVYSNLPKSIASYITVVENSEDCLKSLKDWSKFAVSPQSYVLAEPYVLSSVLPWNSIHFWYLSSRIKSTLPELSCQLLFPLRLRIWVVAVYFDHLWKIRAPIGSDCEGFDLREFDKLILTAAENTDPFIEPQPLWQYTGRARCEPKVVYDLDLSDFPVLSRRGPTAPDSILSSSCDASLDLSCPEVNALAFWAEWLMDAEVDEWKSVAAPYGHVIVDMEIDWCQTEPNNGVLILSSEIKDTLKRKFPCTLRVTSSFDFHLGEPSFNVLVD